MTDTTLNDALPSPEASARRAGLRYVTDDAPGISRVRRGKGFSYHQPDGTLIEGEERERIAALAIPPAWSEVWICPHPDGHLQATGRDDAGRKQYRYHDTWAQVRQRMKFDRLVDFGQVLPQLRARCADDLQREGLGHDRVMALVTTLLDRTLIRIGNDEYATENDSFGLTTMRRRHVCVTDDDCTFEFVGKSGQEHCIAVDDPRLSRLIQECCEVPGYEVFAFFDEDDDKHDVKAHHVNAYLQATTGAEFTSKVFRTWGGTVLAAATLAKHGAAEDETEAQSTVVRTVEAVAERLGNTPAVCRAHYVHPAVLDGYAAGTLAEAWATFRREEPSPQLRPDEHVTLRYLQTTLADD